MKAKIFYPDGQEVEVEPDNGEDFELDQIQAIIGGYYIPVYVNSEEMMLVNEDGIRLRLPFNGRASRIAGVELFGPALYCGNEMVK